MAAAAAKQDVFALSVKHLIKKFPAPPHPDTRPVLEELLYALCREGATTAQADAAFARLKEDFFDWNEVRVSTVPEIGRALKGLPDGGMKAKRLVEFLQELFEADYTFSLEGMEKKGLKQAAKQLARYQGVTDFVVAWVTQRALGGHAVPLDEPGLRVLHRLKVISEESEDAESLRGSVEHHVSKSEGYAFTEALSEHAASICTENKPDCPKCPLKAECPTGQELLNKKSGKVEKADKAEKPKPKPKAK
ncbi:hypothetical protein BH11PLA2_BH11PLA2_41360 [soil metagenome]